MTLSQADSMPAWTVPVLRLVSATHVEPTTGVVISDSGLVLVPADFATIGDEIIVLDGGTDIIRNGRPATIIHRFPGEGLQVLSVTGLRRTSAGFSAALLQDGDEVRLSAFPPAEQIAEGAPPLDIAATVTVLGENGQPVISGRASLPNVTGPLLDDCGKLAGYSSADGVQSMSTSESPRYQLKETLKRLMAEIQLEPRVTDCRQNAGIAEGQVDETEIPEPETVGQEPADEVVDDEPDPDSETETGDASEDSQAPEASASNGNMIEELPEEIEQLPDDENLEDIESLPPHEEDSSQLTESLTPESQGPEETGMPAWLWLVAAALLIGAGFVVHRIRGRKAGDLAEDTQQPSVARQPMAGEEQVDPEDSASSMDSRLVISGLLADGTEFKASCKVSNSAINLIIGRSHADLTIDSPAVSRRHASLNGTGEMLTISDLGSSNGTSINGVPCLEGETMYIQPGDTIILGNARFSYEVRPDSATDSQAQE